jgi:hypothetical protein
VIGPPVDAVELQVRQVLVVTALAKGLNAKLFKKNFSFKKTKMFLLGYITLLN